MFIPTAEARKARAAMRFESTWTFETVGPGKTHLTLRMVFRTKEDRDFVVKEYGAIEGGKQTLGRLSEYLPTMRDAVA